MTKLLLFTHSNGDMIFMLQNVSRENSNHLNWRNHFFKSMAIERVIIPFYLFSLWFPTKLF